MSLNCSQMQSNTKNQQPIISLLLTLKIIRIVKRNWYSKYKTMDSEEKFQILVKIKSFAII